MTTQRDHMENRPARIVAGVDGSADGLRAVEYATRGCLLTGATLHLVHAVDDAVMAGAWGLVQDTAAMEKVGHEFVDSARARAVELGLPDAQITSEVTLGNAAAVLAATSQGALRLVVGRRRMSGLERMFVGSTSASLTAVASCPVVVISAAVNPDATDQRGIVACGVDSDGHSDHTLHAAYREAVARKAKVLVTHVQPPVPVGMFGGYQLTDEAEKELLTAAREAINEMVGRVIGQPEVPVEVAIATGDPVDHLLDLSRECDLLVLGIKAPSRLGFALGGLTRAVLAHAQSPLMVVHS